VTPFFLQTVVRHLGAPGEPHIVAVRADGRLIGLAPLALSADTASFLGRHEVCDYQDLVCLPGQEARVLGAVMDHLAGLGIRRLDLRTLRPDGRTLSALRQLAPAGWEEGLAPDEVTFETPLPADWEAYLGQLDGKQRHEVRRKVRRLETQCVFSFGPPDDPETAADTFVHLFRRNRPDKADFMNDTMVGYFRALMAALAARDLLRLFFLRVAGEPAAAVLCFDQDGVRYLYNSGYDDRFEPLSVGVLSKVFSIRDAVAGGCRRYDFLKGAEIYKRRIGGRELPLHRWGWTI
jgi:CelD/BcsL family acetyltransferase involved in cellulose biosynthesis